MIYILVLAIGFVLGVLSTLNKRIEKIYCWMVMKLIEFRTKKPKDHDFY